MSLMKIAPYFNKSVLYFLLNRSGILKDVELYRLFDEVVARCAIILVENLISPN